MTTKTAKPRRRKFIPECRDCQREEPTIRRNHIAALIQKEVSFFNGWSVSKEREEEACLDAAVKILRYLKRRSR